MSRSRKKSPVTGWTCAASDRVYKVLQRGKERTALRNLLAEAKKLGDDGARAEVALKRWSIYESPKDGKVWWGHAYVKEAANRHLIRK